MAKIFISYRRADSNKESRLIYDALAERFGEHNIFRDKDRIPKGVDFRKTIEEYVFNSDEMLVVIGQKWLDIRENDDPSKRRLDNPEDFVRIEVDMGLRHTNTVTPVVIQNAAMPSEEELPRRLVQLGFQNAYFLRPDHFKTDLQNLVEDIARRHNVPEQLEQISPKPSLIRPIIGGFIGLVIIVAVVLGLMNVFNGGDGSETQVAQAVPTTGQDALETVNAERTQLSLTEQAYNSTATVQRVQNETATAQQNQFNASETAAIITIEFLSATPTDTSVPPTATDIPSDTPVPPTATDTAVPPTRTATRTPKPTYTATATRTPTRTPRPTNTLTATRTPRPTNTLTRILTPTPRPTDVIGSAISAIRSQSSTTISAIPAQSSTTISAIPAQSSTTISAIPAQSSTHVLSYSSDEAGNFTIDYPSNAFAVLDSQSIEVVVRISNINIVNEISTDLLVIDPNIINVVNEPGFEYFISFVSGLVDNIQTDSKLELMLVMQASATGADIYTLMTEESELLMDHEYLDIGDFRLLYSIQNPNDLGLFGIGQSNFEIMLLSGSHNRNIFLGYIIYPRNLRIDIIALVQDIFSTYQHID